MGDKHYGGVLSKLKKMYYPHWERKKGHHRRKGAAPKLRKGSTAAQGKAVDKQLTDYVASGKKPRNAHAKALVEYFLHAKMRPVAAQVPVYVEMLDRITQADLIVENEYGQLLMFEIKSGYNRTQKQGDLKGLPGVPCRQNEIWELQRHYTHKGLVEGGLPIIGSHVVNVYNEGTVITVKKRKVPQWALERLK